MTEAEIKGVCKELYFSLTCCGINVWQNANSRVKLQYLPQNCAEFLHDLNKRTQLLFCLCHLNEELSDSQFHFDTCYSRLWYWVKSERKYCFHKFHVVISCDCFRDWSIRVIIRTGSKQGRGETRQGRLTGFSFVGSYNIGSSRADKTTMLGS